MSRRCEFTCREGEGSKKHSYRIMSHDTLHSWASQSSLDSVPRSGPPRVYLAGYEVFFESDKAAAIAQAKKHVCASWGLEGVFPGDVELSHDLPDALRAAEIYSKDVELMRTCDAICANLTPFRGLSADAGTCWELGHFVGAGKPAVAYTNESRTYEERVPSDMLADAAVSPPVDVWGIKVDMQGEPDNCMMTRGVAHLSIADASLPGLEMLEDLRSFEESIARLAELLTVRSEARSCVMREVKNELNGSRSQRMHWHDVVASA